MKPLPIFGFLLLIVLLMSGCASVPVYRQVQVSRPNMQFSDSLVFSYQSSLIAQVEPGSALSGGSQNAGCTACK